jgi:hypothetical protein
METITDGFRLLMAAVVLNALDDIEYWSLPYRARDEAMAWVNGSDCESFCYTLNTDYRTIREKAVARYRGFLVKAG